MPILLGIMICFSGGANAVPILFCGHKYVA